MGSRIFVLAVLIVVAPLALVVWWEEGQAAEEDEAVREIVAAFEQNTGKQVELVLGPQGQIAADLVTALEAGRRTPDFVFTVAETQPYEQWAYEGRLVDSYTAIYRKGCTRRGDRAHQADLQRLGAIALR